MTMRIAPLLLLAGSLAVSPVAAQDPASSDSEIVVTAQNSGAPMWTIATPKGTIVMVGEIKAVPKATPWFPERLERATAGAQRVILGLKPKVSPGDVFRIIFAGGKITKLPKDTEAADYLSDTQRARLAGFEQEYDQDYSRKSFLMTAFDLLSRRLGFAKDTGKDASDIVERAARRADVPSEPVGTLRGEDLLDNLAEAPPASHLPCLDAAMDATEAGPDIVLQRGEAWRSFDIPALMDNPLEVALRRCWPWADQQVGGEIRTQWVEAIDRAAGEDGVTLAVVPLRVLAEPDGVLDLLVRRGFDIRGPEWRADKVATTLAPSPAADNNEND